MQQKWLNNSQIVPRKRINMQQTNTVIQVKTSSDFQSPCEHSSDTIGQSISTLKSQKLI